MHISGRIVQGEEYVSSLNTEEHKYLELIDVAAAGFENYQKYG